MILTCSQHWADLTFSKFVAPGCAYRAATCGFHLRGTEQSAALQGTLHISVTLVLW